MISSYAQGPAGVTTVSEVDAEVAIVGCGPVGATLAVLLAQLGRRVVVLERWPAPYPLPRAVHFDAEVARILQACGIGPGLRGISEAAHVYEWRNAVGTTLLRFGRIGDGPSGWPESSMFNQPAFEALLDERVRDLPGITLRRGTEVTGLDRQEDLVTVGVATGPDVTARYVVGCDGANSTVRSLVGLPVRDLGYFYDWLIVDVILDDDRVFDPINVQVCDPNRPTTAVSGGPGRRRWEFMRLPHESLDDLNEEQRAWDLLAPWDVDPGNARLERHAVYTFNASHAERWRAGRVLLAGDAAHLMPPFAGQGMCSGIRDAVNLAWKLDLILRGQAPEALLDTYEQERLASVRVAVEFSMALGKVICVADTDEAAARDEAMAAAVGPDLVEVPPTPRLEGTLVHPGAPDAGHLFVQGMVDGRLFDDTHGAGWRLVTTDPDPPDLGDEVSAWFAAIGGKVVAVDVGDPTYDRWFAEHHCSYALQRPDFYLHGTATSAPEAWSLLVDLRDRLASDHTPPPR